MKKRWHISDSVAIGDRLIWISPSEKLPEIRMRNLQRMTDYMSTVLINMTKRDIDLFNCETLVDIGSKMLDEQEAIYKNELNKNT